MDDPRAGLDTRLQELTDAFQELTAATSNPALLGPARRALDVAAQAVRSLEPAQDPTEVLATVARVKRFLAMLRWGTSEDDDDRPNVEPSTGRGARRRDPAVHA
jgi:hypothetical protein